MKPVDADTGEVLIEQTVFRRSNEIVTVFDPSRSRRNTKHVKVRTARRQRRVYEKLTLDERGFLFSLLPFLSWETNIVADEDGKPLVFSQMDEIAGISKNFRIKLVNSLIDKKVIGFILVRGKRSAIVVNPNYALRGTKPDESLKGVFDYEIEVFDDEED